MPKLITHKRGALLATALATVLAGCGSSTASSGSASSTESGASPSAGASAIGSSPTAVDVVARHVVDVPISNYAFHPATITVAAGTRVTFTNHDQTAHTATAAPGSHAFDTGTVNPDKSATVTFKKPGTYTYYCQFHAFMRGKVIVR